MLPGAKSELRAGKARVSGSVGWGEGDLGEVSCSTVAPRVAHWPSRAATGREVPTSTVQSWLREGGGGGGVRGTHPPPPLLCLGALSELHHNPVQLGDELLVAALAAARQRLHHSLRVQTVSGAGGLAPAARLASIRSTGGAVQSYHYHE